MTIDLALPSRLVEHARRRSGRRRRLVAIGLAAGVLGAFVASVSMGDLVLGPADLIGALVAPTDPMAAFVVGTLRLPRALAAILVGASLAISGDLFQGVTRNPLASPDILGVTAGAAFGAVSAMAMGLPWLGSVAVGALVGGGATAALILALAWRGGLSADRFVLVGIGVGAALSAATSFMLTRIDVREAQGAAQWLAGSLNGRSWPQVWLMLAAVSVLIPAVAAQRGTLEALNVGDDIAAGLGVRPRRARLWLLATAVTAAAMATAAAGPIAFVALAAPAIARRLVGTSVAPLASGLAGALLVLVADLVGREFFGAVQLPVGIITGAIGAPYLLWVLRETGRLWRGGST